MRRRVWLWLLLAVPAVFILPALTLAGLLWFRPQTFLTTQNLVRHLPRVEQWTGLNFDLENPELAVRSESFWNKSLVLKASRICWKEPGFADLLCVRGLRLSALFELEPGRRRLVLVRELEGVAEPFELRDSGPETPEENSEDSGWPSLGWLDWERVSIRAERVRIAAETDVHDISGSVESDTRQEMQARVFFSTRERASQKTSLEADADLSLKSDLIDRGVDAGRHRLDVRAKAKGRGFRAAADLKVAVAEARLELGLEGDFSLQGTTALQARLKKCAGFADGGTGAFDFKRVQLDCAVLATPGYPPKVSRRYSSQLPKSFEAEIRARAEHKNGGWHPEATLKILPVRTDIVILQAEARATTTEADVKAEVRVPDFRKAAEVANALDFLVPAPFAVLRGPVALKAQGKLRLPEFLGKLDLDLTTDLRSSEQALRLKADGELRLRRCTPGQPEGSAFEIELVSREARLELPGLDYTKPPALVPDSRFVLKDEKKSPKAAEKIPCEQSLDFRFRNAPGAPIYLAGPFLKDPVPLQVDLLKAGDADGTGRLKIENFSTELFRRRATLERFEFDLGTRLVNGRARVDYTDYRIGLNLTGTVDSVHLDLESDPPLSRQGALSVLLFGRTIEGLDDEQAGSVVSADAAAKNGALSLASLYLFASTPIESVGYNAQTQGVTAKIRLGDGTSLNVGANERGVTDVGVRRRLSKEWRVETSVRNPNDPQNRATMTILEWFRRF